MQYGYGFKSVISENVYNALSSHWRSFYTRGVYRGSTRPMNNYQLDLIHSNRIIEGKALPSIPKGILESKFFSSPSGYIRVENVLPKSDPMFSRTNNEVKLTSSNEAIAFNQSREMQGATQKPYSVSLKQTEENKTNSKGDISGLPFEK